MARERDWKTKKTNREVDEEQDVTYFRFFSSSFTSITGDDYILFQKWKRK
jgi:hypothetical protein